MKNLIVLEFDFCKNLKFWSLEAMGLFDEYCYEIFYIKWLSCWCFMIIRRQWRCKYHWNFPKNLWKVSRFFLFFIWKRPTCGVVIIVSVVCLIWTPYIRTFFTGKTISQFRRVSKFDLKDNLMTHQGKSCWGFFSESVFA